MNYAKIIELIKALWHCFIKMWSIEDPQERISSAKVTNNRLKVLQNKKYMPQVLEFLPEDSKIGESIEENRVPLYHEFKEVLGVEPIIPLSEDGRSSVSHISQYRLAVYVASLSDWQNSDKTHENQEQTNFEHDHEQEKEQVQIQEQNEVQTLTLKRCA